MINYLVYNYSILNFYIQRKIKISLLKFVNYFTATLIVKKIIQAFDRQV